MDLVDIDQVLDNLELREAADESNKAALLRHQQQLQTATAAENVSNGIAGASSIAPKVPSKSFVGVSQVFNSLDDYRKNVESLETAVQPQYDEECRAIGTVQNQRHTDETDYQTNTSSPSPTHNNAGWSHSYAYATGEEDYDEYASSDIHKFCEKPSKGFATNATNAGGDDTPANTSESLTTSSSSTFSSGTSLGIASTTDEHSMPLSPQADDIEDALERSSAQQLAVQSTELKPLTDEVNDSLASQSVGAVEDLAYGLSSISINTANSQSNLHCEPTVSSALGNVLEELTETASTSLLSQMIDDAENQRHLVKSPKNERHPKAEEELVAEKVLPALKSYENPALVYKTVEELPKCEITKQQQPVTFSSTMDEISDTELDSMLQEMDIDDETADDEIISGKLCTSEKKTNETLEITHKPHTFNSTDGAADAGTEAMESLEAHVAADHLNADSFSQASTVEFSEIRAQSLQAQAALADELAQSPNSLASSYSSSNSSLDGLVADGEEDPEGHECGQLRPQRPTTLDLPALKMNLYANAGQTPPGNNSAQLDGQAVDVQHAVETSAHDMTAADDESVGIAEASGYSDPHENLGKIPPIWVPDNMATACMQCQIKFTMLKRRHHCRACGKVLCSVCCSQKFKLQFLTNPEARICVQCYLILTQRHAHAHVGEEQEQEQDQEQEQELDEENSLGLANNAEAGIESENATDQTAITPLRSPNPNNPMEYCSTIPPHRQVSASSALQPPPSVIVPVGVLKKDASYSSSNSNSKQGRKRKSVMFSDGIAPGSDLASMEHQWSEAKHARRVHHQHQNKTGGSNKPATPTAKSESRIDASTIGLVAQLFRGSIPPSMVSAAQAAGDNKTTENAAKSAPKSGAKTDVGTRSKRLPPSGCDERGCFIPPGDSLPPIHIGKDDSYREVANNFELVERLQHETLKFALQRNFFVHVKIVNLKCCMNRTVINFTTSGMHHVADEEIVILLEYVVPASKDEMTEPPLPRDIFLHLHEIYCEAELGNPITELSYTSPQQSSFLGSREYGGFIFIRASFQCLQDVILPENPFLIGILIHRFEVPWAKVFPLRLMLRLGAQYRYYPCPHISMRNRESVYAEIAQTIINFLADFRNYTYTLPCIKGLYIHMEDRHTTVSIPRNRGEDVIKAINNSSDHILAFGGNFSKTADGHLVCMQNVNDERQEMYSYSTQAINIQGQPRKVTGASFFVLNEALKSTSGLSGKCSIVEDGLMVQILPSKMEQVRTALRNQTDIDIVCGPLDADEQQTEIVSIKWVAPDREFNIGVKSPIDESAMDGVTSLRVHAKFNYSNANYSIRTTEIYILQLKEDYNASTDITRSAEQIARSASMALVPFLDLLAASGSLKIGLRVTLHQDNVCYEAGARGSKLPPLYMNALDNHLIPTLHNESSGIDDAIIIEIIFYILSV